MCYFYRDDVCVGKELKGNWNLMRLRLSVGAFDDLIRLLDNVSVSHIKKKSGINLVDKQKHRSLLSYDKHLQTDIN
jgi:hypothetical protein